jgi:hypothetical protein
MHETSRGPEAVRGGSVVQVSYESWYYKVSKNAATKILGAQDTEKLRSLFRDY